MHIIRQRCRSPACVARHSPPSYLGRKYSNEGIALFLNSNGTCGKLAIRHAKISPVDHESCPTWRFQTESKTKHCTAKSKMNWHFHDEQVMICGHGSARYTYLYGHPIAVPQVASMARWWSVSGSLHLMALVILTFDHHHLGVF